MSVFDLISLILYNLNRRKGRVALTAIGVIIGTAAVLVLVSLATGLQRSATRQLGGISDLTKITIYPGYLSEESGGGGMKVSIARGGGGGGGSMGVDPRQILITPDMIQVFSSMEGVKLAVPVDYFQGNAWLTFGKLQGYGQITGMPVTDLSTLDLPLQSGTLQIARGQVVVGTWVVRGFSDPSMRPGQEPPPQPDLLDQEIRLVVAKYSAEGVETRKTLVLKVVGILKETRDMPDGAIFMSLDEVKALNEWMNGARINYNKTGYQMAYVKATDTEAVVTVADQITAMGYMVNNPQSTVQGINSFFTVLQVVFGGVGAMALLVAAIGIANTMTMAILERTREIGLMKAVGASNRDVLSIFLGEAAGIGLIGGLGGVGLGWIVSQLINVVALSFMASQPSGGMMGPPVAAYTPVWLPPFALLFATLVGLLSGLYPALRAATLVPVIALKYE